MCRLVPRVTPPHRRFKNAPDSCEAMYERRREAHFSRRIRVEHGIFHLQNRRLCVARADMYWPVRGPVQTPASADTVPAGNRYEPGHACWCACTSVARRASGPIPQ
ncbi:hypothetical protein GCM10010254_23880 [Streptomyces chromofuscus]|nr:hypothetical protein GCM10010254_23880 [Streptomyces chromofuscus]